MIQTRVAVVAVALCAVLASACDLATPQEAAERLCRLEAQLSVVENALQELLQRADVTVDGASEVDKRKNEFIRFGKRKNEFIRFGKRKNEFIRFGRSDPELAADAEKRKNEFIRFG